MRAGIVGRLVGSSVRRVEDRRLLTGEGRYVDDVTPVGTLHACFLRSPHAHALIRSIDVAAGRRLPGVTAVLTGADVAAISHPYVGMLNLPGLYEPSFSALAVDRVLHVGDPVALVLASSRAVAEDACALIDVVYEPLVPITSIAEALDPTLPTIWPKAPSNVVYRTEQVHGDAAPLDSIFAAADHVVTQRFRNHRQSNQPMETRGIRVEIDPTTGAAIVHSATQSAHTLKWVLALLAPRRPLRESVSQLAKDRSKARAFVKGARGYLKLNPELLAANKATAPVMLRNLASDPGRGLNQQRALLSLLAMDPADRPEVVAHDIGGAFGAKGVVSREDIAVYAAARHLRRSIKWIEDRNEHLLVGGHARDEMVDVSFALAKDGRLLGMKVDLTIDGGAYTGVPYSSAMFAHIIRVMLPGPYRVPVFGYTAKVIASNKATMVAYRGPWAVETWVRERMWDIAARELGLSAAEIRLRNIVDPTELPTPMVTGPMLDVRMSAKRTLTEALALADYDNWPAVQAKARAEGRVLGLGFATFIEAAPGPPGFFDHALKGFGKALAPEPIVVTLDADGTISVLTQQVPHGQGHETTLAQVAADQLGVTIEQVRVRYGDTRITPFGIMGTGGSRSAAMAGGAVTFAARDMRDRILDVAANLIEADRADLTITKGRVHVVGVPARSVALADVATAARQQPTAGGEQPRDGEAIRTSHIYDGGEGGWAQATHVCWVDIDLETGQVRIPRYVVVEDCGELINPTIVEGQVRGGVAQGIGAVLLEKIDYGPDGQFRTGTFMDFLIPTSMEIPEIEIHHLETPSAIEANYRGVGEGGMIAAPAALTNAIENALAHLGVRINEQHLPPFRILELAGIIPRT